MSVMKTTPLIDDIVLVELEGKYFIQNLVTFKNKNFICTSRSALVSIHDWSSLSTFIKECIERFLKIEYGLAEFSQISYSRESIECNITIIAKETGLFLIIEDYSTLFLAPKVIIKMQDINNFCEKLDLLIFQQVSV